MVNKASSIFIFLGFEQNLSLGVIRVLQNNNMVFYGIFRTPSPIGIIGIYLVSQASGLWIELFSYFGYMSETPLLSPNLILFEGM